MSGRPASNTPKSHDIRDSHYYGGDLCLRREADDYDAQASLVWTAYEGGSVSLDLDYWEMGRLAEACEQIRADMRASLDWLDKE